MRLKSLEIKGFKSFADKTHVVLDHPVTGIVGPNGCGKSNIVDAIRWVIGEHKIKALRSDNLEDLIFNGSRTRSGSGMAEVSLTFENTRNLLPTEFNTVTISRKFYKNGESEYRLNDVSCRLKDIHNLFLDTGVSNDSYAIIELGMVDDIIKDKEGSRRRMLEQAAGISIYKTRKKEAKQKLEATEGDLSRIDDLLFEISNNLRILESQARKAEKYFQIKNEYKDASIELAKASLHHFNDQYKDLTQRHEQQTAQRAALEQGVAEEESAVEKSRQRLAEKEQELHALQKLFNELVNRIRQLDSEKKLAAQRFEHLQEREKSLSELLQRADAQLKQLESSIGRSEALIRSEQESGQALGLLLETLRATLDEKRRHFDERKKQLEQIRQQYQQGQHRQFDAEKKVAVADSSVGNLKRTLAHVQEEKENRRAQVQQLADEKTRHAELLVTKQAQLAEMTARRESIQASILQHQETLEQLRAESVAENRKLDSKRNEHDLLKSLVDNLEGYPESIKFLKKNKEWDSKAPLLSDVFVVQPEYRTALERVLEPYLSYYLVPNVAEAAAAIQLLDRNKKGKANFFILDKIPATQDAPGPSDGLLPALGLVTVENEYKPLASLLLGQVYLQPEGEVTGTAQPGRTVVDATGKIIAGEYTLGGGSIGAFEGNRIGRAKNLERLAAEIAQLQEFTAALKAKVSDTQTRIAGFSQELNDRAIDQARQEVNRMQGHLSNLDHRIEHFEQLNAQGDKRIGELETQIGQTGTSIEATRAQLLEISGAQEALQARGNEAQKEFQSVEQEYNATSQEYNQQNLLYTKQQSRIESLKQELNFLNNQLRDVRRQIDSNNEQLKQTTLHISETQGRLHGGDAELDELQQKRDAEEKNLNDRDREYHEQRAQSAETEGRLSQRRREKEQAEVLLNAVKDKLNEMKLQLSGLRERLKVEFKVELDEILDEERKTELSVDELTSETDRIKKRMDNMGEVNPTAIEAFTEMKGRHDFIAEQKGDLVTARESLLATIEEVELTANQKFRQTFDEVRTNFLQVFKALFTEEDTCDLRLTDPDNVADSGIEIYAQPKGKRPSTLTQLSGGEKTLTSTAFLFAIYLIKPAPFCILDEVDAPLDDANVGKFTQMIRRFSDNSQFIIVTHNKQTMAAVDVIYGVTMQEPGVSKLVPVDFRSLN